MPNQHPTHSPEHYFQWLEARGIAPEKLNLKGHKFYSDEYKKEYPLKDNIYRVRSHMFVTDEGHHMETLYAEDYTGQLFRSGPHARAIQIFGDNVWWEPTTVLPARTIDLGKFKIEQMRFLRLQN